MRVLLAVGSRYGSTREIAEAVAEVLRARDLEVTVTGPEGLADAGAHDAVLVGSAVYVGHWLKPVREAVEAAAGVLAGRPVWLFSSGPVGDPPQPADDPLDVAALAEATGARGHRVFAGKLDRKGLRFADRAVVTALRVPDGDVRDWEEIRRWAGEVATELEADVPAGPR